MAETSFLCSSKKNALSCRQMLLRFGMASSEEWLICLLVHFAITEYEYLRIRISLLVNTQVRSRSTFRRMRLARLSQILHRSQDMIIIFYSV